MSLFSQQLYYVFGASSNLTRIHLIREASEDSTRREAKSRNENDTLGPNISGFGVDSYRGFLGILIFRN